MNHNCKYKCLQDLDFDTLKHSGGQWERDIDKGKNIYI